MYTTTNAATIITSITINAILSYVIGSFAGSCVTFCSFTTFGLQSSYVVKNCASVVTTSSPIGMAIYGKELGSVVDCQTPNGNIKIQIMGKVLKEEQEETLGR